MSAVLVFARLGLAVVFAAAGVGKFADLAGSRRAVRTFGVSAGPANVVGTLLPLAELAVAVALIGSVSARWGRLGRWSLLSGFAVGIGVALRAGRQPDCHCFGQLHSAPVGWRTLARNLVLRGRRGDRRARRPWTESERLVRVSVRGAALGARRRRGALIVAGQAALIWSLLRRHGAVLLRLRELEASRVSGGSIRSALPVGDPAPTFDLPGLGGERVSLAGLLSAGRGRCWCSPTRAAAHVRRCCPGWQRGRTATRQR